ncbi:TIM barrel protein [Pelagicoccus sp. SDUM812003]|uniref:hydroxypyruvate isomerase family protein n=1 Tax=Pelagicoccus sp. SDUM812003 TaxID=3041267 RepID=UPI0028103A20|nr:TIM barrel protein [Pelagicoccus sp. SDUM812003]MDQ8203561.1 TIM barrel protein [Pelagicoccus sp. SDUM812003]
MNNPMHRRDALKKVATGAAALAATRAFANQNETSEAMSMPTSDLKRNIHHSACRWCYKDIELDELCRRGKEVGLEALDLVNVDEIPTLRENGLDPSLIWGVPGGIVSGLNRLENHDNIVSFFETNIPQVANAGAKRVICFSGNRDGLDDEEGLENCKIGLQRITPIAEKHGILVVMELLNSKRNHPDYQCDHTAWGVELVKRVESEAFKLLYDIYHMQIMDGDVIATIQENHPYFGHYHTGGVPGRHEIDETQELFYPAIMRAILETGYDGYVAQEFVPSWEDPIAALAQGIRICDV